MVDTAIDSDSASSPSLISCNTSESRGPDTHLYKNKNKIKIHVHIYCTCIHMYDTLSNSSCILIGWFISDISPTTLDQINIWRDSITLLSGNGFINYKININSYTLTPPLTLLHRLLASMVAADLSFESTFEIIVFIASCMPSADLYLGPFIASVKHSITQYNSV